MGFLNNTKGSLTAFERALYDFLLKYPNGIKRDELTLKAYDVLDFFATRAIDQHVFKLNKKLIALNMGSIKKISYRQYKQNGGKIIKLIVKGNTHE